MLSRDGILGIADLQDMEQGFLFAQLGELVACGYNRHRSVPAARNGQTIRLKDFRSGHLRKIRRSVWVAHGNGAKYFDVMLELLIYCSEHGTSAEPKTRYSRIVCTEQKFRNEIVLPTYDDFVVEEPEFRQD